jgi:uncharacterized membrane protein (DUF106 family)
MLQTLQLWNFILPLLISSLLGQNITFRHPAITIIVVAIIITTTTTI